MKTRMQLNIYTNDQISYHTNKTVFITQDGNIKKIKYFDDQDGDTDILIDKSKVVINSKLKKFEFNLSGISKIYIESEYGLSEFEFTTNKIEVEPLLKVDYNINENRFLIEVEIMEVDDGNSN